MRHSFIATADWHLWPTIWNRFQSIVGDAEEAAKEVLKYSNDNNLPIICAGDIIDHGEQGAVSRELNFLAEHLHGPDMFYYIVGNHEISGFTAGQENPRWMKILEALPQHPRHIGEELVTDIGGLRVGGLDYRRGSDFSKTLVEYKKNLEETDTQLDVFVMHQALKETLGFEGAYQSTCDELAGIAPLVIVGDIHVPRFWEHRGTHFLSPGSLAPNRWSEIDFIDGEVQRSRYGFWEVVMEKDEDGKISGIDAEQRYLYNSRAFFEFNVPDADREAELISFFRNRTERSSELKPSLARIRYPAEDTAFVSELKVAAAEKNIILDLVPQHASVEGPDNLQLEEGEEADILNIIGRHVDLEEDALLAKVVQEILESGERPDLILDRYVSEIKEGKLEITNG